MLPDERRRSRARLQAAKGVGGQARPLRHSTTALSSRRTACHAQIGPENARFLPEIGATVGALASWVVTHAFSISFDSFENHSSKLKTLKLGTAADMRACRTYVCAAAPARRTRTDDGRARGVE